MAPPIPGYLLARRTDLGRPDSECVMGRGSSRVTRTLCLWETICRLRAELHASTLRHPGADAWNRTPGQEKGELNYRGRVLATGVVPRSCATRRRPPG